MRKNEIPAVQRWTTPTVCACDAGGFVAYGDYLTLERRLREVQEERDRAYSILALHGVPQKRAKSVSNGIQVLMTRMQKAIDAAECAANAAEQKAARMREALLDIARGQLQGPSDFTKYAQSVARAALGGES